MPDARNVRRFVRIVMKNVPIVLMQRFAVDVMYVKTVSAGTVISVITVKPVSTA